MVKMVALRLCYGMNEACGEDDLAAITCSSR